MGTDNVSLPPNTGKAATREAPYSGELAHLQIVGLATLTGPDDDKAARDVSAENPIPVHDEDLVFLLQRLLLAIGSPPGYDRSLQRGRVTAVVESGNVTTVTTVTTVSTVTTVGGLTNIDGRNGAMLINQSNLSAWRDCVRSCIT